MSAFLSDLRHALRSLRRSPGFTAVAVVTLALGMGATASVFTLIERVVLDPVPYPQPDRLVRLKNQVPGVGPGEEWQMSTAQYFYFREHAASLAGLGIYQVGKMNIAAVGEPQRATGAVSNAGLLALLGARVVLGRLFDESDDVPSAAPVVLLSHGFWQRQFGGDLAVLRRTLRVNELPRTVVGFLAPGVDLPQERGSAAPPGTDFWFPMQLNPAGPFYNNHVYPVIARLAPGSSIHGAEAELRRLTADLPGVFPQAYSTRFFERYGFQTLVYSLQAYVVGDAARNLWILFGAVSLVLLIACANAANLLLVRVEGRRRELSIRSALGAGRGVVARHALAEGLVLAGAGGVLALFVASASISWLARLAPSGLPRLDNLQIDASVLAFTFLLVVVVALGLSVLPTLLHGPVSAIATLGDGGRSASAGRQRQRVRSGLVMGQVALAMVLVIASGLLIRSFNSLRRVAPGFDPGGVLTLQLFLPYQRYSDLPKVWQFYSSALERMRALPGVVTAGASAGRVVSEIDPAIPLANAEEMRTLVARSMSRMSFTIVLLGVAGGVALGLAAIGLYGTVSYVVARRTNEIGVRMALGARPAEVQRLVVRSSVRWTAAGVSAGLVVAFGLTRLLRGLLFGVGPTDPLSYAGAIIVLTTVALLAGWVPARRAARVDPVVALRAE